MFHRASRDQRRECVGEVFFYGYFEDEIKHKTRHSSSKNVPKHFLSNSKKNFEKTEKFTFLTTKMVQSELSKWAQFTF